MRVVSTGKSYEIDFKAFPSPYGVWVVSARPNLTLRYAEGFRPLAGCGLFLTDTFTDYKFIVSVPLRGVGYFEAI